MLLKAVSLLSLNSRFGQTMKHAGVAVSITTFTDVIAFFIGSNTVLPGLQSFCIYAAVAIFCIYALQITHFVAWFSLGMEFGQNIVWLSACTSLNI